MKTMLNVGFYAASVPGAHLQLAPLFLLAALALAVGLRWAIGRRRVGMDDGLDDGLDDADDVQADWSLYDLERADDAAQTHDRGSRAPR